ncbi:MAG: hypothetical protein CBC02_008180 [Flavobacteriaceae bacterium TMED42]|nr:MAG: hypothetical protein CBC02_008180 [Flavobacteriaceae bacterium TMED42]
MSNLITPNTNKPDQSIRDWIAEQNSDAIMINGYDHCILGISPSGSIIYSVEDILKTLVGAEHTWNFDDAIEWFEFNIQRSFTNKKNEPIFVQSDYSTYSLDFSD